MYKVLSRLFKRRCRLSLEPDYLRQLITSVIRSQLPRRLSAFFTGYIQASDNRLSFLLNTLASFYNVYKHKIDNFSNTIMLTFIFNKVRTIMTTKNNDTDSIERFISLLFSFTTKY